MGGLAAGKLPGSRWINVLLISAVLLAALQHPARAADLAFQSVHPLIYGAGTAYVFTPTETNIAYRFYAQGSLVQTVSRSLTAMATDVLDLAGVTGLHAGSAYSLVIAAEQPVETAIYTILPGMVGDSMGAAGGSVPVDQANFGPLDTTAGKTASVAVFNPSETPIQIQIQYYNSAGSETIAAPVDILGYGMATISPANGFYGRLRLSETSGQPFAGVLQSTGSGSFALSPALQPGAFQDASSAYAWLPRVSRAVTEGLVTRSTQALLFNVGGFDREAAIQIVDAAGLTTQQSANLAPNSLNAVDLSALPTGTSYSVRLSSNSTDLTVGEASLSTAGASPSAGYGASAYTPLAIPGLLRDATTSSTLTVQNPESGELSFTLALRDLSGNENYRAALVIPGMGFTQFKLSELASLDAGFEGTAVITSTGMIAAWVDRYSTISMNFIPMVGRNMCAGTAISLHTITDSLFYRQGNMLQIHADDAWKTCALSDPGIVVAVIDTGVDQNHPDLAVNLLPGISFVDGSPSPEDANGHGTHVTGIVAAGLNGVGVVGVAPQARILPVRVLGANGIGNTSWIAAGIRWAADRAQILNLSLGSISDDRVVREAVDYAVSKGRLVVAAAGNCGGYDYWQLGCAAMNQINYPAGYASVVSVAAVTSDNTRATFSNANWSVDIAAPGASIYSSVPNDGYGTYSGTSQATPHVAGLAALIWARYPAYSAAQLRAAIENTAVDLGSAGRDNAFGAGLIDAMAALQPSAVSTGASAGAAATPEQAAAAPVEDRSAPIDPGVVLVEFGPDAPAAIDAVVADLPGVQSSQPLPGLDLLRLRVPTGAEWPTIDRLRAIPGVAYAGPDYLYQIH